MDKGRITECCPPRANQQSLLQWGQLAKGYKKGLIEMHAKETGSLKAAQILADWDTEKHNFLQVCPKEMLVHIPHPLSIEETAIPAE